MNNFYLISLVSSVFSLLSFLIIIRVILSWIQISHYNRYVQIIFNVTEPILEPFRNITSSFNIGIDISPMLAIFALNFIRNFIIRLLY